ncbi:MAG: hypothetical protein IPJ77_05335 [Planctomycetes bacterium]|nr:hypothetical protein [Planctomycetota bacterium]
MNIFTRAALSILGLAALATGVHANGRNPGSMLVFPEFTQGNGTDTILTITNTNQTTGVRVHLWYISGDTATLCQESNRVVNLGIRDTFTTLVSAQITVLGPTKGFVYAYAENAQGAPISFNHLAGDLLIVNGSLANQYSVEVLPFRSPKAEGETTRSDQDTILDMNDTEYEKAPAKVIVPRFMGQSATAPFQSDLVLISLSGGRNFTTIVDFLAFNDNEEVFSAQHLFSCWKKTTLLNVNGIFSKTFLQNFTNDSPTEIRGSESNEAGFFTIDGNVAYSTTVDILDPVVIAVLIEKSGTGEIGAELPFFQGTQLKGDLLPGGNTWDGD